MPGIGTINNWHSFYQSIRDASWPDCNSFEELDQLPSAIQREIRQVHIPNMQAAESARQQQLDQIDQAVQIPYVNSTTQFELAAETPEQIDQLYINADVDYYQDRTEHQLDRELDCNGIRLRYHNSMECGGVKRADMFRQVLDIITPGHQYEHCLEWCSGAGFIGYSLLGAGVCAQLDLCDIWKPALDAAEQATPEERRARTWHIRRLQDIPEGNTYDLVIGSPPWFPNQLIIKDRTTCDPGLNIHREFFQDVGAYLKPGGRILLIEGQTYIGPRDLQPMLDNNGLEIVQVLIGDDDWHWFPVIQKKA